MSPDRRDLGQLTVLEMRQLFPVVVGLEIKIGGRWHQQHFGLDAGQRHLQIAAVEIVGRNIAVLPGPELGQQVFHVAAQEVGLPGSHQEILKRCETEAAPHLATIEGLAERPAGIDAAHGAQALLRRRGALQSGTDTFEENEIMRRGAGRAAIDHDAFDRLAEQRAPVIGLLRAHRPAIDQLQAIDGEQLQEHLPLQHDVVVGRDLGERRRVGGRCREAVRQHVGDDDEVAAGIEAAPHVDQPFDVGVMGAVAGRIEDDIVALGRQRAVGFPDDAGLLQRAAALQPDMVGRPDAFVRAHVLPPLAPVRRLSGLVQPKLRMISPCV